MGISLRYHVVTLVAVFLMLLVGLLVGVGLSSQPELTRRIDSLSEEFKKLMDEDAVLRREATTQEKFAETALPKVLAHRLDGRRVVLVVTERPPNNRVSTDLTEALAAAGATVPYRLVLRSDFPDRAVAAYGAGSAGPECCAKAAQRIAEAVARSDESALRDLEKQRLVHVDGRPGSTPPSSVIVLGGASQPAEVGVDAIDRPLIERFLALGVRDLVGCEPRGVVTYADAYRDLEISTVDNVDLVRGRMSLVLALAGKPGHYGDGRSAEQEFAPLE